MVVYGCVSKRWVAYLKNAGGGLCEGFCGPTEGMGAGSRLLLSANLIPKRQLMGSASKIVSFAPSVLVLLRCTVLWYYGTMVLEYWKYLYRELHNNSSAELTS